MIKEKLKQFKVQIRRQQRNNIFAEKRKEHQNINQVEILLKQIFDLKQEKQNFESFKELFHKINQNLIQYSKGGSKGVLLDLSKIKNEKSEITYNPLGRQQKKFSQLTSQKFKRFTLSLIEQASIVNKSKLRNDFWQVSQQLLFEISFMVGLLFKEPASLISLFPFKALNMFLPTEESEDEEVKEEFDEEDVFEMSFELLETNLFYLNTKFSSLKEQSEDTMTLFLNICHSISTVMQFFVINNIQKRKGIQMSSKKCQDQEKIAYLYSLLKSHNFKNYLQSILEEISCNSLQDENQEGFSLICEVSVFILLASLINRYLDLVQFVKVQSISVSIKTEVKKFCKFTIEQLCYQKEVAFKQQKDRKSQLHKNAINIHSRVLFQLHSLINQSLLSFNRQQALPLCFELIEFLIIKADLQLASNKSYFQVSYDNEKSNLKEFYFSVLVAEEDDIWMHFLEILICLEQLVKNYDFTLQEILHYAIEQNVEFNQKIVKLLFQSLSESITLISGYFYNQRHIFMSSLVSLFDLWIQNSFPSKGLMWGLLFWYEIAEKLQKTINQIEQSVKDIENINFQLNIQKRQTESSRTNKHNVDMMTTLQELRTLIDDAMNQANENDTEKKMEIYD